MKIIFLKKVLKFLFITFFVYFIISYFLYLISALFLTKGKILNYKILVNYQINFYNQLGFRNIWQTQNECVEFDNQLIYVPKIGKCLFNNPEFRTELNFTNEGRDNGNNSLKKDSKNSIAVLGDSYAMGWGVNDNETFAANLERETGIKVYNLAVSSYATERSLLRLKKLNLIDEVKTIIIQYCYNDYGENETHNYQNNINNSQKYESLSNEKLSIAKRLRKSIRYSLKIPLEIFFNNKEQHNWENHEYLFEEIINKYEFLSDKKIIVIGVNGPNKNFLNFPDVNSKNIPNLRYKNIDFEKKDFFIIDGHLNKSGHKKISDELKKYIN